MGTNQSEDDAILQNFYDNKDDVVLKYVEKHFRNKRLNRMDNSPGYTIASDKFFDRHFYPCCPKYTHQTPHKLVDNLYLQVPELPRPITMLRCDGDNCGLVYLYCNNPKCPYFGIQQTMCDVCHNVENRFKINTD